MFLERFLRGFVAAEFRNKRLEDVSLWLILFGRFVKLADQMRNVALML